MLIQKKTVEILDMYIVQKYMSGFKSLKIYNIHVHIHVCTLYLFEIGTTVTF